MKENEPDIKYLFVPRSIAIIGASHDQKKIGIGLAGQGRQNKISQQREKDLCIPDPWTHEEREIFKELFGGFSYERG